MKTRINSFIILILVFWFFIYGCASTRSGKFEKSQVEIEKPQGDLLFSSFLKYVPFRGRVKQKDGIAFYIEGSSSILAYEYIDGRIINVTYLGYPGSIGLLEEIEKIGVEPFNIEREKNGCESDEFNLTIFQSDSLVYEYTFKLGKTHFQFEAEAPSLYIDYYSCNSEKLVKFKKLLDLLAYNYGRSKIDASFEPRGFSEDSTIYLNDFYK